jgi:alkyl hydroperoxide reductase subunit AhpC
MITNYGRRTPEILSTIATAKTAFNRKTFSPANWT